jgi:hypothetical protein
MVWKERYMFKVERVAMSLDSMEEPAPMMMAVEIMFIVMP